MVETKEKISWNRVHFTSLKGDWSTPQELFDELNEEFQFTLDACADESNYKCERYFTKEDDGLIRKWDGIVWINPPYGRGIGEWIKKAYYESLSGATVVMLLPARTDTKWFHDYVTKAKDIRFIIGRLKFSGHINSAPFPSMIVVFRRE
jgi:phage N-6-adenine-methyltransferase